MRKFLDHYTYVIPMELYTLHPTPVTLLLCTHFCVMCCSLQLAPCTPCGPSSMHSSQSTPCSLYPTNCTAHIGHPAPCTSFILLLAPPQPTPRALLRPFTLEQRSRLISLLSKNLWISKSFLGYARFIQILTFF